MRATASTSKWSIRARWCRSTRRRCSRSVAKTGRLVVVDEAPLNGGLASAIAGMVAERGFWSLKAPIVRVARADTPIAYSAPLEKFVTPGADAVEAAVRRVLKEKPPAASV